MELNIVHLGDSLEILKRLPDNSVDSVVTDPPYGISFMSKGWDTFAGNKEFAAWCEQWARECLRVLKPGGHLLAFSGTRTYHAMAWGVEAAGFEIRDMIEWLYLTGFPKSLDVSKAFDRQAGAERKVVGMKKAGMGSGKTFGMLQAEGQNDKAPKEVPVTAPVTLLAQRWQGWGTALKPGHEPVVVARKPLVGTVCNNVEQFGTGALNIDGCRIAYQGEKPKETANHNIRGGAYNSDTSDRERDTTYIPAEAGRFPANCITLEGDAWFSDHFNVTPKEVSKKSSKKDRNSDWQGQEIDLPPRLAGGMQGRADGSLDGHVTYNRNHHPTVKPVDLMAWLIKLVTPPGGVVLDPFAGSGSTLVAAKREGFSYVGIERNPEYIEIIEKRVA